MIHSLISWCAESHTWVCVFVCVYVRECVFVTVWEHKEDELKSTQICSLHLCTRFDSCGVYSMSSPARVHTAFICAFKRVWVHIGSMCVHMHLCAACLMFHLREGLSRYSDQRAAPQLLTLSFVLCNHKALTSDTKTWWRLRFCSSGSQDRLFTLNFLY